ncbi:MAG: hypothetical protein KC636_11145 [Myxococcales bacterium]|nr:hypothetical protein [Myxococcales bacterium]
MSAWMLIALPLAVEPDVAAPSEKPAPHVAEDGSRSDRVHLQLDSSALWGIGGQMFLGAQLRFAALFEHWTTRLALGTWDVGLAFAYQNEPLFLAFFVDNTGVSGATHRTQLVVHGGHTVHMGRRRRSALGLYLFGGWTAWRSAYTVSYPAEDVNASGAEVRHKPVAGGELRFVQRLHRRVGLNIVAGGVFPTASSYVITFGHIGVGLSFYLR